MIPNKNGLFPPSFAAYILRRSSLASVPHSV